MDKDLQEITSRIMEKAKSQKPTGQKKLEGGRLTSKELEKYGIYKRFQNITFESIESRGLPIDKEICSNYNIVKKYTQAIDENIESGIGIIFAGGCGTMKSSMAVALLRYQVERGQGGLFVPMCSLIDNLFTMNRLNKEECARYEERIRKTPLLILDVDRLQ